MRVLLVNESARCHTGGAHRVVVETSAMLAAAGHDAALAYWDEGRSEVTCPVYKFSVVQGEEELRARWEEIVRDFRPDIVQLHLVDHPFFLEAAGEHVPMVRFLHDQSWFCSAGDRTVDGFEGCQRPHSAACLWHHYARGCGGKNPLGNWQRWRRVDRNMARVSRQRFQVASDFMARGLQENGISRSAIDVVSLYARRPAISAPAVPGRMAVASRLVRAKGVHVLIEACKELGDWDWTLNIAGDGPERSNLELLARQLGVAARVRFLGELKPEDVDAEIAIAELVITPTLRPEPFGLIGPEAMAHGKPVIGFNGGATPEWLQNGVNGAMVAQRSGPALAEAIRSLFSNRLRMKEMGKHGQAIWRERFSEEAYIRRLLESFDRIIKERSKYAP